MQDQTMELSVNKSKRCGTWVGYKLTHTLHKTAHRLLRTTATTPSSEHYMQQLTTWTHEDGHIDARNMQSHLW